MIFSEDFLGQLRKTSVSTHTLKEMIILVATKIQDLETELKNEKNRKEQAPSADEVAEASSS
jgi:hypothetical protein